MTEAEACQVLEVSLAEDQELDDEMLKAAYRYDPSRRLFSRNRLGVCAARGLLGMLDARSGL